LKNKLLFFWLFCAVLPQLRSENMGSWGDQGNGTYINPVLNADYSDPDVIRVENKYYMVCSEFHYMGMTIQESDDMVNWKIVGRIYDEIDIPGYDCLTRYAEGSWAPAIRYHDRQFWVYFCTPHDGLFLSKASKPEGPWSSLVTVKAVDQWEDPCPFWDEDGQAYLGHSLKGAGPIIIHKMSADGTKLLDEGKTVYTGPVAEGTKLFKRDGYYYISIPEGGVGEGWQTVLRSRNIYGPYEKKVVLETGSTSVNGPHQGAIVETPKGEWWFYHFQSAGALGRVMHLQPMCWHDDWPVIGVDIDRNGIGEPVFVWKKPDVGASFPIGAPQTDDEFNQPDLGLQWQWNHNPVKSLWSLTQKPGWLSLKAQKASSLKTAHNTLTQKVMGCSGEVFVQMDACRMVPGQKAGLCSLSSVFNEVGVTNKGGRLFVYFQGNDQSRDSVAVSRKVVYFKLVLNLTNQQNYFQYSFDNKNYVTIGKPFEAKWGYWKGTRIGLFSYNEQADGGTAAFNYFHYSYDGPK
jgi:beta-xylosidase